MDVLVPVALDEYSYAVPEGMPLAPGDVVLVPLGKRETAGVVWTMRAGGVATLSPYLGGSMCRLSNEKIAIFSRLDCLVYACTTWAGDAIGATIPEGADTARMLEPPRIGVRIIGKAPQRMTAARSRVLASLAEGKTLLKRDLAHEAGVSQSVIDGLLDEGTLEAVAACHLSRLRCHQTRIT